MSHRFPECLDCAFDGEPAICDVCEDADQFEEAEYQDSASTVTVSQLFEYEAEYAEAA